MGKRIIHECDLTKQEFNPDEDQIFTLSIAKKGRKAPMKYELSASAAERLLAQLNGSKELDADWRFAREEPDAMPEEGSTGPRTLGDLEYEQEESEDDSHFVASKKAELREAGILEGEREEPEESTIGKALGAAQVNNGCAHLNKGPIQTTLKNKKRFIFRVCRECRQQIPEMTAAEREQYLRGKTPEGVHQRDLEPS